MNKDLQETLRAILKEELQPIHQRLDHVDTRLGKMDSRLDNVDNRLEKMDSRFDDVDNRLEKMDSRFDNVDNRLEKMDSALAGLSKDVETLKVGQEKLQRNLIDSLGQYTEEIIRYVDDKTEVLNERLYKVEVDVATLKKQ